MPIILFFLISLAFAYDDPTGGKAFGPWLYNDQIKPMVKEAGEPEHLAWLGGAVAGSVLTKPYDRRVRNFRNEHGNLILGKQESAVISDFTNGWVEVGVALTAITFDTPEGVKLSRALIFNSLSTGILKHAVQRERPDKSNDASWPSGHTSAMFAMAGSLTGSYGLTAAIPAYSAATLVALARMKENKHWLSDVVGGAFIGTYWATVTHGSDMRTISFCPVPVDDGMMLVFNKSF